MYIFVHCLTLIAMSLLVSLFAGGLFYLLKIIQKKLGNRLFVILIAAMILFICSLLIPLKALGLLIFFVALATVYYLTRQQDIIIILVWLAVYFVIVQLALIAISIINDSHSESNLRVKCASNLKQFGVALFMYAEDNNGYFPDKDGDAGLEMLRQQNYLTDDNVYLCPSTSDLTPASDSVKSSYIYHGGFAFNPTKKNIVMEDKPGNHKGYSNYLYCNGVVKGYSDPNYRKTVIVQEPVFKCLLRWFGWR
jgi:hypothetical protein